MSYERTVSVVIPTKNRFASLWSAISSVVSQGGSIRQIIVVDDGSCDLTSKSYDLLRSFDSRIEILSTGGPSGGAVARNMGAKSAKCEYIAFLDDDDIWLERKVDRQLAFLIKHKSCGAVLCPELRLNTKTGHFSRVKQSAVDRTRLIAHFPCPGTSCLMMRRPLFDLVGGFNPTLQRLQDWDFYLRLASVTKIGFIRDPLTLYIDHAGDQISKSNSALYPSYRRVYLNIRASLTPREVTHFRLILFQQRNMHHFNSLQRFGLKLKIALSRLLNTWFI